MEVVAEGGQRDACRVRCLLREEEQGAVEGGVGDEGFGCLAALLVGGCATPASRGGGGPCLLLLLLGVVGRRVGVVAAAAAAAVVRVCDWGRG